MEAPEPICKVLPTILSRSSSTDRSGIRLEAAEGARRLESRARDEERRHKGPPWSAVMALIKSKITGALFNRADREIF
jgi:hypothetical protein